MRFRARPVVDPGLDRPGGHPIHRRRAKWTRTVCAALVRWQLASGSHGISIGGSTGEPSAQTVAERIAAMGSWPTRLPTGCRSYRAPARRSSTRPSSSPRPRSALGADAVLVITPYYARPTQEACTSLVLGTSPRVPAIPIVLYNVPVRTAVDVAPETVARLRRGPRQHRRHQGDHQGLRALLADVPSVRPRPADVVGHRAAVPALARARWDRFRQRGRQPRARGRSAEMYDAGSPATTPRRGRPPLRPAPAGRPAVRRDQPRPVKRVLEGCAGLIESGVRAPAAGPPRPRLGSPASTLS